MYPSRKYLVLNGVKKKAVPYFAWLYVERLCLWLVAIGRRLLQAMFSFDEPIKKKISLGGSRKARTELVSQRCIDTANLVSAPQPCMLGGRALGADQACKLPSPFESGGRSATMRARSVNRPVITCSCMSIVCTRAGFIARRRIRRTFRQFVDDACALGGGDVALLLRRLLAAGTDDFGRVQAALALTCQALLLPRPVHSTSEASSPGPSPGRGAYVLQPLSNKELHGLASITLVQLERIYALPAASVAERGLAPDAAFCFAHAQAWQGESSHVAAAPSPVTAVAAVPYPAARRPNRSPGPSPPFLLPL